ncbi:MAG: hypothetical protein ACK56F_22165, partial [bacterium]
DAGTRERARLVGGAAGVLRARGKRVVAAGDPLRLVRAQPRGRRSEAARRSHDGRRVVEIALRAIRTGVREDREARDHRGPGRDVERAIVVGVELVAHLSRETADHEEGDVVAPLEIE